MTTRESKPKPGVSSSQTRIVIENVYESRAEPNDGAAVQMSLLFFTTRPFWARASKIAVAHFNSLAQGGSRTRHLHDKEVMFNSEVWFSKVVCTLFIRSNAMDACLGYLSKNLNPSIAFEVIRRLKNPKLGLKFFEFSRVNLNLKHSVGSYDLLMRSLCQMGLHDSAKFVFDCMRNDGHFPNCSIIEILVSSFARAGRLEIGEKLLDELNYEDVKLNSLVYNSLLRVLVKRNQVAEAVCLFKKHCGSHFHPDVWTFNILIQGLCGVGDFQTAFEILKDMMESGCSPDTVTYNTLINGLSRSNQVDKGHNLLRKLKSNGSQLLDSITFTSVISGYCKSGRMREAREVFDEMIGWGIMPTDFTFNTLINGFSDARDMASATASYEKMKLYECRPDVVTFTTLIKGYCRVGQLNRGLKLWHEMRSRKVYPNKYTFSVLILALCRENKLLEARDLLKQLNCTDIVTEAFMYNPVIDGFCKAGNVDEANLIVAEMEAKRCRPDKITFTMLILGNCMKARMSEAIGVFNKMVARGIAPDEIAVNGLVSFLNKAGMPDEATRIKKFANTNFSLGVPRSRSKYLCEKLSMAVMTK